MDMTRTHKIKFRHVFPLALLGITLTAPAQTHSVAAPGSDPHALQLLQSAVHSELAAADNDHSHWTYRDYDKTAEKNTVATVVETPAGALRRTLEKNGRPLTPDEQQQETARINAFVADRDAQAKQRKSGQHDDEQARQMMLMLPNAFVWRMKSETPELATLTFVPDPNFHPSNMEARVMGMMAGELTVVKPGFRIRTLRGALTDDVKFAFGLFGKLRKGGTFDVERREVAPGFWEITETRVHISGKALFKTIGQEEDEIKTDWKPSTATTLEAAAKELNAG